ncbi:MAG: SAM-dependent methyltransferase, partial [Candidatus Omnitrophica bacterium]|nr:SAM-dependent methyltransferase [Candidatus Omnitrophota bacterium]
GISNIFPAELERIGDISEVRRCGIDKIVIDAPCSGTGTLRRNPDAKWKLSEDLFRDFQRDQMAILEKSLPFLKARGRLFYITCSIEPCENEEVLTRIFTDHPELHMIKDPESEDGYFRLWPHTDGTDGFFMGSAVNNK